MIRKTCKEITKVTQGKAMKKFMGVVSGWSGLPKKGNIHIIHTVLNIHNMHIYLQLIFNNTV